MNSATDDIYEPGYHEIYRGQIQTCTGKSLRRFIVRRYKGRPVLIEQVRGSYDWDDVPGDNASHLKQVLFALTGTAS